MDRIQLNDANSVAANAYTLLNSRLGWEKKVKALAYNLYFGADNLLNCSYSLGNDINAFGNRYFNPAAPRTWNAGLSVNYAF